jgi:ribosomal protein S12 methylthiotransferase accessory factor
MELMGGSTSKYDALTPRSCEPQHTWEKLRAFLPAAGISRVANVTGLDVTGVPVWAAIRPNSRSLAVSQGKGTDHESARVSAVMEAVEQHHAERTTLSCRLASWDELQHSDSVIDVRRLPQSREGGFHPRRTLPWVHAEPMSGEQPATWVPFEMVHANAVLPRVPGSGCFVASTNGLASGNNLAEAALHGLCEVIERDALSTWSAQHGDGDPSTQVDSGSIDDPVSAALLQQFVAAGVDVAVWDVTSDVAVPTYRVILTDRHYDPDLNPKGSAFGAGCSPDPCLAIRRALTEAAQSRVTTIAGARDDLTRDRYRSFQQPTAVAHHRQVLDSWAGMMTFRQRTSMATPTIEGDLHAVLERVAAVGAGPTLMVDLSRDGWPVSVCRIIVAGLEGPQESPSYVPGARARAAARATT